MVLKLYGYGGSSNTRRVAAVLREKKIPFELVHVDIARGESKAPAYLKNYPFGQVPAIDDNGFVLYESRAIARYLEAKYPNHGPKLIPTGIEENALFEQGVSIELAQFQPPALKAAIEIVFKRRSGYAPDVRHEEQLIKDLGRKLDVYEIILSKQKYIGGNEITLADFFHLPVGALLEDESGTNIMTQESRPNVARWWKDIANRESWVAVKDGIIESNA